jgi:agmatine deiminase
MKMCSQAGVVAVLMAAGTVASLSGSAFGQGGQGAPIGGVEPPKVVDVIRYDPTAATPRNATPEEKAWRERNPIVMPTNITAPTGPLSAPGEYDVMDGLIMNWQGPTTWTAIVQAMTVQVTTVGNGNVYLYVDSIAEWNTVSAQLATAGANISKVFPIVRATDAIWIRDYGPRIVYEGQVRTGIEHFYNIPSRVNDDNSPIAFTTFKNLRLFNMPLVHGGGNYHLNSMNTGFAARLIVSENTPQTEAQVIATVQQYYGVSTTMFNQYPAAVDGTGHIDMWMQVLGANTVLISDWPNNVGSTQDIISDNAAATLLSLGWNVVRTPSFSISGVHYTFTNMVMFNNIVMVPTYTNATVAPFNTSALATIQGALPPGKTAIAIPCQNIISAAGAIHCIVMHVPANKNGANPGALVRVPNGGESYAPGSVVPITWNSDDDLGVTSVNVELSLDGGSTFPITIASGLPGATNSLNWTIPQDLSFVGSTARVRVVASDASANTGQDVSDNDFIISPPPAGVAIASTGQSVVDNVGNNNNNARLDPGETFVRVVLPINNGGQTTATGVTGTLTSSTPGITINTGALSYGSLAFGQTGASDIPFRVSVSPTYVCGTPAQFTLTVTSDQGSSDNFNFSLPVGVPGGVGPAQTFSYTTPDVAIPDNNATGITVNLPVSGATTSIADVNFRFDGTACTPASPTSTTAGLNHAWVGDLEVSLISPANTTVVLMNQPGGPNNGGWNFCQTLLDDQSTGKNIQAITLSDEPHVGSFRPANLLSAFNGQDANGTWRLRVRDLGASDVGSLRRFSVLISGTLPPTCTPPVVSPCIADIADNGSNPGPDGAVDNGDFSLFVSQFFNAAVQAACDGSTVPCASADVADNGSNPGADGLLDNGDFSAFISGFFGAPCV